MTTTETKRIEKIARESAQLAHKALRKSNELQAYLSILEFKAGKVRSHKSVRDVIHTIKGASVS